MTAGGTPDTRPDSLAPGVALRAARNAQNLSVGEVARQLRLSVAQVEALEASAFDRLPGPVFVRGFIRNYARLLKLDPEPLLRSALPVLPSESAAPISAESRGEPLPAARRQRWPRYALVVTGLLLVLAGYEYFLAQPSPTPTATQPEPVTVAVPVASAPAEAPASVLAPASAEAGARDAGAGGVPDAAAGPSPTATVVAGGEITASSATGKGEILLHFDGDSWVEVRDRGGNPIFSQLNRRGSEQRISGTPPLVVIIGNAHGVRLTYNDRRIDLDPHTKNAVARLTLE